MMRRYLDDDEVEAALEEINAALQGVYALLLDEKEAHGLDRHTTMWGLARHLRRLSYIRTQGLVGVESQDDAGERA